jgi:hypothetical protein
MLSDVDSSPATARERPSAATSEPLPQTVRDDLEAIHSQGRPQREGAFFVGSPSASLAQIKRWFGAIPLILMLIYGLGFALYALVTGTEGPPAKILMATIIFALIAGAVGFGLGTVVARLWLVWLRRRARGEHLLGNCRECVLVAPEGLVWHDGRGLLYVPWENVDSARLRDGENQHTEFTFTDNRTRKQHVLETFGIVGIYRRAVIREIASAVAAKAQAAEPRSQAALPSTSASPAPAAEPLHTNGPPPTAAPRADLTIRPCPHCGTRVIRKSEGTCPSCGRPME